MRAIHVSALPTIYTEPGLCTEVSCLNASSGGQTGCGIEVECAQRFISRLGTMTTLRRVRASRSGTGRRHVVPLSYRSTADLMPAAIKLQLCCSAMDRNAHSFYVVSSGPGPKLFRWSVSNPSRRRSPFVPRLAAAER